MDTGEVFAWLTFLVIITLLFFAAFGSSEVSEQNIEDYMQKLMKDQKKGREGNF
tara:strand:- start:302 stop:463 length:162 start_codon:yes stop_codon:yes gene_type:complete